MINKQSWIKINQCKKRDNSSIILTIDIDWACDDVLLDSINLIEEIGVPATWFVTHKTKHLARLRENDNFELGIHPNFVNLLDSKDSDSAEKILDKLIEIVPEATSIRSHSMVQSSRFMDLFKLKGMRYDCNHFIPEQSNITLKSWEIWNKIIKVPHFWEDDVHCLCDDNASVENLISRDGLKVFAFHPINIFLNTESMDRYENARKYFHVHHKSINYRFKGDGTRTRLKKLLSFYA